MMHSIVTLLLAFALPLTFAGSQANDRTTKALQGTWVVTSMNGQDAPAGAPELSITFTGDKYHQALGGDVNERGSYKIDTSKKPMTIELTITEGQDAGKTQLGVFEVTADTLRANLDTPGANQRPSDFTAKEGSLLFVAKKKPAK
jgi:uncharacterized protein (TIGR03067 family)